MNKSTAIHSINNAMELDVFLNTSTNDKKLLSYLMCDFSKLNSLITTSTLNKYKTALSKLSPLTIESNNE